VTGISSRANGSWNAGESGIAISSSEVQMRTDLVFGAMGNGSNHYLLTMLASKAVHGMHKPRVRIEDTTKDVLVRFSCANPITCEEALREPLTIPLSQDDAPGPSA
jgi:hypothetical protein